MPRNVITQELAPRLEPRFLRTRDAADYCGLSVRTFLREVKEGIWPAPMTHGPRLRTWDKVALDLIANQNIGNASATGLGETDVAGRALDQWLKSK